MTGCVARDTTKPAAGQAADAFLLTHAKVASGAGEAAGPAQGGADRAQGAAGAGTMDQQYRLMAEGDVNFAPHVNHQVRVTGMMMGRGMAQTPAGGANRPEASAPAVGNSSATGSAGPMAAMFHVNELTMVSATCETN